ncbi:hypothetical protein R3P38DRAFT_2792638 [Favolaschia claudopus]|uniref:Uncharacterized protein n=1 Tax=Favolaschia claudopus TaxID=2862362 RepID=A0AAW0AF83_9AGAR
MCQYGIGLALSPQAASHTFAAFSIQEHPLVTLYPDLRTVSPSVKVSLRDFAVNAASWAEATPAFRVSSEDHTHRYRTNQRTAVNLTVLSSLCHTGRAPFGTTMNDRLAWKLQRGDDKQLLRIWIPSRSPNALPRRHRLSPLASVLIKNPRNPGDPSDIRHRFRHHTDGLGVKNLGEPPMEHPSLARKVKTQSECKCGLVLPQKPTVVGCSYTVFPAYSSKRGRPMNRQRNLRLLSTLCTYLTLFRVLIRHRHGLPRVAAAGNDDKA